VDWLSTFPQRSKKKKKDLYKFYFLLGCGFCMMSDMEIETLFDLKDFAHKELFEGSVWSALLNLKEYVDRHEARLEIEVPEGVWLQDRHLISIGKGTIIEPGVLIQGPCIIGERCRISHGAYLRPYVVLGDDCHVGHAAELKHSILLNGAAATHFVYVGDSIIGNRVNLGAGVKCANLRLDRGEVKIGGIPTGLKKLGGIVGDGAQVGCNSVLNPGTVIARGAACKPAQSYQGMVGV
jgi:NDP-sugar pyrophosphorylase family protein